MAYTAGKLEANAMKRGAAGAHLPTPWLFEPAKCPDDRADYYLVHTGPSINQYGALALSDYNVERDGAKSFLALLSTRLRRTDWFQLYSVESF